MSMIGRMGAWLTQPVQAILGTSGDPYWSNVVLLLHGDGADGSTVFTDSSPTVKTMVRSGPSVSDTVKVQVKTANSMFGGASLKFNGQLQSGNGSYLDASGFTFTDQPNITWEAWVNVDSSSMNQPCSIFGYSGTSASFLKVDTFTGSVQGRLHFETNGRYSTGYVQFNTWTHVALVKVGSAYKFYINGVSSGSFTYATALPSSALRVGAGYLGGTPFRGYMDDVRLTYAARYTANFTPPTQAFPDVGP